MSLCSHLDQDTHIHYTIIGTHLMIPHPIPDLTLPWLPYPIIYSCSPHCLHPPSTRTFKPPSTPLIPPRVLLRRMGKVISSWSLVHSSIAFVWHRRLFLQGVLGYSHSTSITQRPYIQPSLDSSLQCLALLFRSSSSSSSSFSSSSCQCWRDPNNCGSC